MCNYYPSRMKMHRIDFPSSEHAYQWRFLKYIGQHDLTGEAIKATSPAEAKAVVARVPKHLHKDWYLIKKSIMKEILHIKADFSTYFKQSLLDSASSRLVEAIQGDLYWSSDLPPYLAETTKFYPGRNELSSILESVCFDIMKTAVLSQTFLDISIENEDQSLMESVNTIVNYIVSESHDSPPPLTSPINSKSHDNEHTPPPPPGHSNELVPDIAHHINIVGDNDPSLIVTHFLN